MRVQASSLTLTRACSSTRPKTGLPSQETKRICDEIMATVVIPMHYRDGNRGGHRLETVRDFAWQFESPELIHYYDTDTFRVEPFMEPQVAVLKFGIRN